MEGSEDLNTQLSTGSLKTERIAIIIIILFHTVGIIGFNLPGIDTVFLDIVPWHLLLMAAVIIWSHNRPDAKFGLFTLLLFILGFGAELIGVHTGWLFGSYMYGNTLGIKLFNVPLMIGVNWFLLIYATGVLMQRSRVKNVYARILVGALLLVLLDILIEPVAIHFDYWHWTDGAIPIKNYFCWFAVSGLMLFIFEKFKFPPQSKAAPVLLLMEFVFFMILGLVN
jgi:putative membrane protein